MIIREKLRFPSGSATAQLIAVLHGTTVRKEGKQLDSSTQPEGLDEEERRPLLSNPTDAPRLDSDRTDAERGMPALVYSFAASAATTVRVSSLLSTQERCPSLARLIFSSADRRLLSPGHLCRADLRSSTSEKRCRCQVGMVVHTLPQLHVSGKLEDLCANQQLTMNNAAEVKASSWARRQLRLCSWAPSSAGRSSRPLPTTWDGQMACRWMLKKVPEVSLFHF